MAQKKGRLRVLFLGTPDFAATILKKILPWEGGEIMGVYTQPDRPCGRGRVCTPPPVKQTALEHSIPVFQPGSFKDEKELERMASLSPDVLAVAAYGMILPQTVLDIPCMGAINVHASLLPRYRGAAPIQRAIMNGDPVTGITIMRVVRELDAGPILLQRALAIGLYDTARTIHDELADLGGTLLVETLSRLKEGTLTSIEQDHSLATYAPKLEKGEGLVDWNQPAMTVHNRIRALFPWPGAFFDWETPQGKSLRLTLYPGKPGDKLSNSPLPGTILGKRDDFLAVACSDREYLIPRIKPAGGKEMDAQGFVCGYLNRC